MIPIGLDMLQAKKRGYPFPELIQELDDDSRDVTTVKQMIKRMTVFEPKDRAKLQEINEILATMGGQ